MSTGKSVMDAVLGVTGMGMIPPPASALGAYAAQQANTGAQQRTIKGNPKNSITIVAAKLGGWIVYATSEHTYQSEPLLASSSLEEIFELIKNKTLLDV